MYAQVYPHFGAQEVAQLPKVENRLFGASLVASQQTF
jgi:hypothetical protein